MLAPETTVLAVQRFLVVSEDNSVLAAAFDRPSMRGPGDYKVEHTESVHAASVGRGKRVPVAMLPPALLEAVNSKLEALGYGPLDRGWNASERAAEANGNGHWATRLSDLMELVCVSGAASGLGPFAVLAEDHRALRWVVDPQRGTIQRGDGEVEAVLTGTARDLVALLTGDVNVGVLLRSGRVRHISADGAGAPDGDATTEVKAITARLRHGISHERRLGAAT